MQMFWVQSLVWEDPTCHGATKPVHYSYGTHMPQQMSPHSRACAPQQEKPVRSPRTTTKSSPCSSKLEKALTAVKIQCSQK